MKQKFFKTLFIFTFALIVFLAVPAFHVVIQSTVESAQREQSINVRTRRHGQYLTITFSSLKKVKTISYILTYKSAGQPQGVTGTIEVNGESSIKREIYLGTCSGGVYRPHLLLTDGKLEVTATYKSGRVETTSYNVQL